MAHDVKCHAGMQAGNRNCHIGVSIVRAHTHMPSDLNPDPRKTVVEYIEPVSAACHLDLQLVLPAHGYFRFHENSVGSVSRIEGFVSHPMPNVYLWM